MMRRAALLLFCCACLRAQPAAIGGVVVNQATGEPMAGVHVRFLAAGSASEAQLQPYGAVSDRGGRFSVIGLPAGLYFVSAQLRGFFRMPPKSQPPLSRVSLKAGQQLTDLKIEMAQAATISGRVLDDNGDPVRANVQVENETERPIDFGHNGRSDERGEFRISVAPGKYYLIAQPNGVGIVMRSEPERRTDGTTDPVYGRTYYPGSAAKAKAVLVEVAAGAELTGMDIHLAQKPRGGSISGMVNVGAEAGGMNIVTLFSGDGPRRMKGSSTTGVGPDGYFQFSNLEPGAYRLLAWHRDDKSRMYSLPVDISVDGNDLTDVNLALAPAEEMTGTLEMPGGAGLEKLSVSLVVTPMGLLGETASSGAVDKSGTFRVTNIAPLRYRVQVTPMPENAYLKSVRWNGAEAPNGELDLSHGSQGLSLKIAIGLNGGQISGKLLDTNGEPVGGVRVMVLLVNDPKAIDMERSPKMADDGTYRIQAIRPGKYRLLAFDPSALAGTNDYLEAVEKLAAAAEEIEIKEGDRKVHDLKLMGKEDADAKPHQ